MPGRGHRLLTGRAAIVGTMHKPSTPSASRAAVAILTLALFVMGCGSADTSATDSATEVSVEETTTTTTAAETTETTIEEVDETSSASGPDIDLFFDGALAQDVTTEDCTLSGGAQGTCYRITVVGYPADTEVGPFCPETTDATADEAGIWFDGEGLYDLDGEFILGLAELYDDPNWLLYDEDGNVNITDTIEAFEAAARPDVDPDYQNHCVEGRIEWLDGGEPVQATVLIPTAPVAATSPGTSRDHLGVTLNGVTIDVAAPVQAILGAYTIAAFDDCGGHINPFDGYHLHGAVGCGEVAVDGHAAIFGYALDGYAIHSPYDTDGNQYTDLDSCGGHTTDDLGYHYHASPAAENSVIGCFTGQTATG